jgi:prepilin-type N-terminal cleavage/methylation domain-containing protein
MKRGFTLLELLVVISIIGLLSSVVVSSTQKSKEKAGYAKASRDITTMRTALELYYQNNGDWPPIGSANFYYSDTPHGWPTLGNLLRPVLSSIPYPSYSTNIITSGGRDILINGYSYFKGTSSNPQRIRVYNSVNNNFVACVIIYQGYYLSFATMEQNDFTLKDGGTDPDTIEKQDGDVRITYDPNDCP